MDVVVTVPKWFWLDWIDEGDAVGEPPTGEEWGFFMGGPPPRIEPGERVYVVAHGRLRGYAPLTRVARTERGFALCRQGGAVAVTIAEPIGGFRGWRERWWKREEEIPFPNRGVGFFDEDPKRMQDAIDYLRGHSRKGESPR